MWRSANRSQRHKSEHLSSLHIATTDFLVFTCISLKWTFNRSMQIRVRQHNGLLVLVLTGSSVQVQIRWSNRLRMHDTLRAKLRGNKLLTSEDIKACKVGHFWDTECMLCIAVIALCAATDTHASNAHCTTRIHFDLSATFWTGIRQ